MMAAPPPEAVSWGLAVLVGAAAVVALWQQRRRHAQEIVRLQAEVAELARASELKTRFLANVSHELRTPLTSVTLFAQMLQDEIHGPLTPLQRETVEKIRRNGESLLYLISDLLDLARVEAGRMALTLGPVVLGEVLETACAAIERQRVERGLDLQVEIPPEPLVVSGSFQRLVQVFTNLLSNAVKFTDRGAVGVRIARDGARARVQVWDTGPGIPAQALDRVFDEFVQGDDTTRRRHGGTGLGLAICRRLVVLQGGEIRAESPPGGGAVFTVTLPLQ